MFIRWAFGRLPGFFQCLVLLVAALWIGAIGLRPQPAVNAGAVFATITVTTTADTVAADGQCSLREAIQAANTNATVNECSAGAAGLDTIEFNLGAGTPVLSLSSSLPAITQALTIDGATGGATRVALDGVTNGGFGLDVQGTSGCTIRGLVIRRFLFGIRIQNSSGNTIQNCFIGTNNAGDSNVGAGNSASGIVILNSANNTIGGTAAGAGNVIAFNSGTGVRINVSAVNNRVLGNSIFGNNQLGIDLAGFGVSGNDPGDGDGGANNLQNFPVLASAVVSGGSTKVRGTLNSTANATFRIEFFANSACDPSGNGEGQTYLGFTSVTTDGGGNASFTAILPGAVALSNFITATATDASGNTSEFSACLCVYSFAVSPAAFPSTGGGGTITVSNGASCAWTAVSNAAWITVTGGTPGAGNGVVPFTVAANAGATARVGSITIAGQPLFISQAATGALVSTDFSEGIPPGWTVGHNGTGNYPNGKPATWTTDNPCNRVIPAPFVPPFAIVDSAAAPSEPAPSPPIPRARWLRAPLVQPFRPMPRPSSATSRSRRPNRVTSRCFPATPRNPLSPTPISLAAKSPTMFSPSDWP